MRFERRYTTAGQSPYAGIPVRKALSEIRNPDGSVVFRLDGIDVPPIGQPSDLDDLSTEGRPTRTGAWDIRTPLVGDDAAAVNEAALVDLDNGATSLHLDLSRSVDLSRALRAVLPSVGEQTPVAELVSAATRVGLARSFYNTAVQDTRSVRLRRIPRALRLAGHRAMPEYFEIDDTALSR